MDRSPHSVLVGQGASTFAQEQVRACACDCNLGTNHPFSRSIEPTQGFPMESVLSPEARAEWERWKEEEQPKGKGEGQHDTIGLIVRDAQGNLACGTCLLP